MRSVSWRRIPRCTLYITFIHKYIHLSSTRQVQYTILYIIHSILLPTHRVTVFKLISLYYFLASSENLYTIIVDAWHFPFNFLSIIMNKLTSDRKTWNRLHFRTLTLFMHQLKSCLITVLAVTFIVNFIFFILPLHQITSENLFDKQH